MKTTQRDACLIVTAARGFKREAYSLIRRAGKQSGLTVLAFISERENRSYGLPNARFIVPCTDAELEKLLTVGRELAAAEGWDSFPVDSYHD